MRAWALVDAADFEWLNQWRWCLSMGYAVRTQGRRTVLMHRLILDLDFGDPRQGEHINRNRLDYRQSNLRIAERGDADNQQNHGLRADNSSGYRGVSLYGRTQRWQAQASLSGKMHHLGYFDTPEQADAVVKAFRAQHMPFSEDAALAA